MLQTLRPVSHLLTAGALLAIRFYQRAISPYKGFCCAYCSYTGNASCSTLGLRAVRRYGVWRGVRILDGRLAKCGLAFRRYRAAAIDKQAGMCDLPCDGPCDLPCDVKLPSIGKSCGGAADCVDLGSCCDWNTSRKQARDDADPHIPPRREKRRRRG